MAAHINEAKAAAVLANGRSAYIAVAMLLAEYAQGGYENNNRPVDLETGTVRGPGGKQILVIDEIKSLSGAPGVVTGTISPDWELHTTAAENVKPFTYTEEGFTMGFKDDGTEFAVKPKDEW